MTKARRTLGVCTIASLARYHLAYGRWSDVLWLTLLTLVLVALANWFGKEAVSPANFMTRSGANAPSDINLERSGRGARYDLPDDEAWGACKAGGGSPPCLLSGSSR